VSELEARGMPGRPAMSELLRAWWWHRQGLGRFARRGIAAEVLARCGWARSVGSANPYLTLFARCGALRSEVDSAVAALAVHELPSARAAAPTCCLPRISVWPYRSAVARGGGRWPAWPGLGVTRAAVDRLCSAVLDAVSTGPWIPPPSKRPSATPCTTSARRGRRPG